MSDDRPHVELSKRDDDLADALLQPVGGKPLAERARFDHSKRNWHLWDGLRWKKDQKTEILDEIRRRARAWFDHADSVEKKKIVANLFDSAKKESVLKALASRPEIAMVGDEWDTQAHLIGCQNGTIDLRDGTFDPSPHPDLLMTRTVTAKWDPEAECPRFIAFVREIMGGDEELADYLIRLLGYALFGWQREQKFWMWVGQGNNGKGTLAKVMSAVMGSYADTPADTLYMKTKYGASKSGDARADLVKLQGIRWTWMSEPQGGHFNDELIKSHTGDDPIQARALYSNNFVTFRPTHTIIFLTNDPPRVADVGQSMRRRVRIIRFDQDFSAEGVIDRGLEDKLKEEKDGIFRLLVLAATQYYQHGLPEPAQVVQWASDYIEENDPLGRFVAERCNTGPGLQCTAAVLYGAYEDWTRHHDMEAMSQTGFGLAMGRRFPKEKGRMATYFNGIAPKSAMQIAEADDDS